VAKLKTLLDGGGCGVTLHLFSADNLCQCGGVNHPWQIPHVAVLPGDIS